MHRGVIGDLKQASYLLQITASHRAPRLNCDTLASLKQLRPARGVVGIVTVAIRPRVFAVVSTSLSALGAPVCDDRTEQDDEGRP